MKEVLISSPWYPIAECMGAGQSCIREGLEWILYSMPLPGGWSNPETDFLERCSVLKRDLDNALDNML